MICPACEGQMTPTLSSWECLNVREGMSCYCKFSKVLTQEEVNERGVCFMCDSLMVLDRIEGPTRFWRCPNGHGTQVDRVPAGGASVTTEARPEYPAGGWGNRVPELGEETE